MNERTPAQRQHMLDVADAIESHPDHFDMATVLDVGPCGSVACIAGWSDALSWNIDMTRENDDFIGDVELGPYGKRLTYWERFAVRSGLSYVDSSWLCGSDGIGAADEIPVHLRAKGISDALRQIADGANYRVALDDVVDRYGGAL